MTQLDARPGDAPAPQDGGPEQATRAERRRAARSRRRRTTGLMAGVVALVMVVAVVVVASGAAHSGVGAQPAPADAPAGLVLTGRSMPDPFVLVVGSSTYLYTGGYGPGAAPHLPVREFTDLEHVGDPTDAMPTLPSWSWGWIWTVDVDQTPGGYVMWFTSKSTTRKDPNGALSQCIGEATSTSPLGPFVAAPQPVICSQWGSIDPRMFTDTDGQRYLIWKSDTNADHTQFIPTPILSQKLAADGTTLVGSPVQIAVSSQRWEQGLIESPDLRVLGGRYYLFFSGNQATTPSNGIGMATCQGPQGPCSDTARAPFLASNSQGRGPGEESLYQQDGVTWLLYSPNAVFGSYLYRPLAVARVSDGPHGPYLSTFGGAVPG